MPIVDPVLISHDGPPDISVWRVDIPLAASLTDTAFSSLSSDERARAQAFRRHEDALRFATVRAALRERLAARLDIEPHAVRFALDANRRPHLADSTSLDFNVSHAGAHGVVAMSALRRVGVDIEACSDRFDWRSITTLTLAADEAAWIECLAMPSRAAAFYDAWVAKEALVKTTGVGIARGLQHLSVLPRESTAFWLRAHVPEGMRDLQGCWLPAPQTYAAGLAWSASAPRQACCDSAFGQPIA
ncbi:4'-phosphopantetheinyl transferase [Paraburkholderia sp. GAS199]|uniref:4'-phosphopantetheinyl transferase family protein n=1 Tax=Paraburkholderia sp. GAS199 TaxID=3035126 RepID=UPI003D25E55A